MKRLILYKLNICNGGVYPVTGWRLRRWIPNNTLIITLKNQVTSRETHLHDSVGITVTGQGVQEMEQLK